MQKEVSALKSGSGNVGTSEASYDLAVFGISIGSAGIILAIIGMIRNKPDFRKVKP